MAKRVEVFGKEIASLISNYRMRLALPSLKDSRILYDLANARAEDIVLGNQPLAHRLTSGLRYLETITDIEIGGVMGRTFI